jgi:hypothetical protein
VEDGGADHRCLRSFAGPDRCHRYLRAATRGALLHLVDARVGDQKVEGAELIGHDPDRHTYATHAFGTDGLTAYEASLTEETEGLTWRMQSETTRFTGRFSEDRNLVTGHWELQDDGGDWRPWMDITLTKQAS